MGWRAVHGISSSESQANVGMFLALRARLARSSASEVAEGVVPSASGERAMTNLEGQDSVRHVDVVPAGKHRNSRSSGWLTAARDFALPGRRDFDKVPNKDNHSGVVE